MVLRCPFWCKMLSNMVKKHLTKPLLQPSADWEVIPKKPTQNSQFWPSFTHVSFDVLQRIYDSWIKGAKPLCLFYNSEASSDLGLLQLLACAVPWVRDNQRQRACVCVCLCVCVFVCTAVKVAAAVGINQPAGLFEASVSFHFQKKNLAEANLILLLQGKRGSNQSERLKDRWTERGRKVRMLHIEDSLPSKTERNKNQASHMIKMYKTKEFLLSNSFICDQN